LMPMHINKIYDVYQQYREVEGFSRIVTNDEILSNDGSLLVTNYIASSRVQKNRIIPIDEALREWEDSASNLKSSMTQFLKMSSYDI
jgi:type I restriction enzyme M protein